MGEFEEYIWSDYDDYDDEPEDDYVDPYWDSRVNPCPECDYGEVISTDPLGVPFYESVCSAGCGWSA